MPVFCLVYASTATQPMAESDLHELLATARETNADKGVTGLLLYAEGNFIQILEGDRAEVEALYEHIARDPRHYGAVRLMRRNVGQRSFSDWQMGFKKLDRSELDSRIPGFSDLLMVAGGGEAIKDQVSKDIWALLMSFREVTRV